MENVSIFLTKFWGWYLLIFFVILSFNPRRIKQIFDDLRDEKFLILSAIIAIIVGLVNILLHNIWEPNEKLIITLLGWMALFVGLSLFIFPQPTVSGLKSFNVKFVQVIYILLFLLGVFLLNSVYGILLY